MTSPRLHARPGYLKSRTHRPRRRDRGAPVGSARSPGSAADKPEAAATSSSNSTGAYVKSRPFTSSGAARRASRRLTATQQARRAPRVQHGELGRLEREGSALARRSQQRRDVRLHVVEVRGRAQFLRDSPLLRQSRPAGNTGEGVDLARRRRPRRETRPVLEQPNALLLAALILERRAHQSWPQRHAHHRQVARDRVRQRERVALREQSCLQRRIDEGERDRLLVAARGERLEQRDFRGLRRRQRPEALRARARPFRESSRSPRCAPPPRSDPPRSRCRSDGQAAVASQPSARCVTRHPSRSRAPVTWAAVGSLPRSRRSCAARSAPAHAPAGARASP